MDRRSRPHRHRPHHRPRHRPKPDRPPSDRPARHRPAATTRHQNRRIALLILAALLLLGLLGYAVYALAKSSGGHSPSRTPPPSASSGPSSSASAARITVPDVTGDSEATARQRLVRAGFTASAISVHRTCSGYSAGRSGVLDQSPAAGADVAGGSSISLTAEATDCLRYPDETGRPASTARSDLAGLGFTSVSTLTASGCSGSDPAGTVESQSPAPGGYAALRPFTPITLTAQPSGCSGAGTPPTTAPTTPNSPPPPRPPPRRRPHPPPAPPVVRRAEAPAAPPAERAACPAAPTPPGSSPRPAADAGSPRRRVTGSAHHRVSPSPRQRPDESRPQAAVPPE
ncbi:PASTA domain-containing protein [Phaeacidiphilus oryzae]|uniref:PASTA domain-containing protein n=1 Tax=Phaeacidiphilus oryzae TaxID=348818 RepID=UPI003899C15E